MTGATSKELVEQCIALQAPDRIPVLPITCVTNMKLSGRRYLDCLLDHRQYVAAELECWQEYGQDWVTTILPMEAAGECLGARLKFYEDDVPALLGSPIAETSDFDRIARENRDIRGFHRVRYLADVVYDLKKAVGDGVPVMGYAHSVFRLAGMLRGLSNLYMDLVINPAFVQELQDFCLAKCVDFAAEMVKAGADILIVTNPIANADCMSKEMYRNQVFPHTKRLYQAIRDMGAKLIFHSCGNWNDRFDLLVAEEPHIIWVDKVDLTWLKEKFGRQVCVMGNVRTTTTMLRGTPDEVRREALECLRQGSPGGGYILSADCVLPRDVPGDNLRALIEAACA